MIGIKNVSKSFGEKLVLDNVSFTAEDEILGLLGPNFVGLGLIATAILALLILIKKVGRR